MSNNATYKTAAGTTLTLTSNSTNIFKGTTTFQGSGSILTGSGAVTADAGGSTFVIPATALFSYVGTITVPVGTSFTVNGNTTLPASTNTFLGGGGTLVLNGVTTHSGTGQLSIGTDVSNTVATTLRIPATKAYNFTADSGIIFNSNGGNVVNQGTLRKLSGGGVSLVTAHLVNTGTLAAASGTLAFRDTTSTGGSVSTAAGAVVAFCDAFFATFTQQGVLNATGAGTLSLPAGLLQVSASGATFNIAPTLTFQWAAGTINVPVGTLATVNGNLRQSGAADVVLNGGGTMTFNGTVTQTGTGNLRLDGSAGTANIVNIPVGKSYIFAGDNGFIQGNSGGGVVNNNGTISKTASAGTSLISTVLSKAANINVNTGVLTLGPPGGVIQGGNFNVAAGAVVNLTNLNTITTMSGTFTGTGAGKVQLAGGSVVAAGGGPGLTFNFPSGQFSWLGGTIHTNGLNVNINGAATISGANDVNVVGGATLHIKGTLNHAGTGTLRVGGGAVLSVDVGAALNIQGDADIGFQGSPATLSVAGTLRKTLGTGLSSIVIPVTNTGTIEVQRGTLELTGGISEIVGTTLTGGKWTATSTAVNNAILKLGSNIATIGLAAAVTLNGPNSSIPNLSALTLVQGSLSLSGGAAFSNTGAHQQRQDFPRTHFCRKRGG